MQMPLFLLALFAFATASADQVADLSAQLKGKVQLSAEERRWIKDNPVIRIGADQDYGPYTFRDQRGNYQGLALDYLHVIEALAGLSFEPVAGLSWTDIMLGAKNKEVDMVVTATVRPERLEFLNFSEHFFPAPLVVMTSDNQHGSVSQPMDLENKIVALVRNYAATERVLSEVQNIIPYFVDTPSEALEAVALGKAEAYVGVLGVNAYLIRELGLANVVVSSYYDMHGSRQYFALRKDWPMLKSIIDKTLRVAKPYIDKPLTAHWIPIMAERDWQEKPILNLTNSEQNYLTSFGSLKFCSATNQAPYASLNDDGDYDGVFADFITLIKNRLGIELAHVTASDHSQALELLEQNVCHFLIYIDSQPVPTNKLEWTEPLAEIPLVFVTRQDIPFINGYQDLDGQRLAQVSGFDTPLSMLADINAGNSYAGIGLLHQMAWLIREKHLFELKISGKTDEFSAIRIAVPDVYKPFYPILQKALRSITEQDKQQVMQRWLNVTIEEQGFPLVLLAQISVVVVLLGLLLLYRQHVVSQHNQMLSHANRELEQAYQDQETLIRMVSHEYRTPLAVMNSGLNLLRKESGRVDEKMDRRISMMLRATQRLRDTINMTLQYDRWKLGYQQRDECEGVCSLAECIEESIALQADSYPEREITVTWLDERVDDLMLSVSKHDLVCCLDNLISNALKYSEEKPVEVEVTTASRIPHFVTIAVIDQGTGIAPAIQSKVFDKFYRAHNTKEQTGAGLGLHIVDMLMRKYGGNVHLESNVGKGSRFVLELPDNKV